MTRERIIFMISPILLWGVMAIMGDVFAGENEMFPQNAPNFNVKTSEGGRKLAQARTPVQKPADNKKENDKKPSKEVKNDPRKSGTAARPDNRTWTGSRDSLRGKKNPELLKLIEEDVRLEQEAAQMKSEWKAADAGKKEEIKKELKEVIQQHFQVRQKRRLHELQDMEDRIQEMRKVINARESKMESIVNKRVEDLLEKDEELEF